MKSNIIVPNTYKIEQTNKITKYAKFCSVCAKEDKKNKENKNNQLEVEIKKGQLETFIDPTAKISRYI